jgi:cytosine/adenosine deaminase-related metal-dependent hydrolase
MVVDAGSVCAAPGALLLEGPRVVAAGAPESIGRPADARIVEHADAVVLPALVNAHGHLDLSHLGPFPYTGSFTSWVDVVRSGRHRDEAGVAASVREGVRLSRAGGTALMGDIAGAGSLVPIATMRREGLAGVGFLEVFGVGRKQERAVAAFRSAIAATPREADGVRLGLQPHAPYSCGPEVYGAARALAREHGLPVTTHLAETPDELRFCADATGPLADLLRRLDAWDETIVTEGIPAGSHPVDAVAERLAPVPAVLAHLNYVEERHLEVLRAWGASVAYCPRASAYFGHPRVDVVADATPHRYRAMLEAGINVALGTDGLPCLDTPDRISVLDEMRLLYRRDGADPRTLLAMATVNGARALGVDPAPFTLRPGVETAGVLAVPSDGSAGGAGGTDPLRGALESAAPPAWVMGGGS